MNALRASGYTTVNLWTLHVYADAGGSLIYNDQLVVANGAYVIQLGVRVRGSGLPTEHTEKHGN